MNRIQVTRGAPCAAAMLALALMAPAPVPAGQLAAPTVHAGGVDFLPGVAYAGATVRVSGQGLTFERTFAAGERLSIGVFDPDGQLLPDGVYTWRLELAPSRAAARDLRRAARQSGGVAPEPWEAMTGAFAIRDALVADPSLRDRRPPRPRPAGPYAALPLDLGAAPRGDRVADDGDEATAAGRAPAAGAVTDRAGGGRTVAERTDAATLAAGPAPVGRAAEERPIRQRSWLTDGKNGRDR